ncbi:MAG TPA: type IV toxin-antitoxin system AbiEi family antitoxin domain-containing protein [Egibacteraceae bacterium]
MGPWDRLRLLAARQDDVVTFAQVLACGVPARTFADRARRDRWPRLHRGVWVVHSGAVGYRQQLRGALLAGAPDAALTGISTLWLAKAVAETPRQVDLWLPPGRGPRPSNPVRVTRGALVDGDLVHTLTGLPTLSYARAVTDLAATASVDHLVRVIAALDRLRLASPGGIAELAARRGRFPGVVKLRVALARVEDDLAHSETEALGRRLVVEAGLRPHPAPYPVAVDGVVIAEIDIAFPPWRYGAEVDGPHHLLPEVARADKARDRALHGHGWWIDRFTTDEVERTPQAFVAAVRRGLEAAKARAARAQM